MRTIEYLRNSTVLRLPLLAVMRFFFSLLEGRAGVLRRAAYDAMPVQFLVTGSREKYVVSTSDKVIGREVFLHGEFDFAKFEAALRVLAREGRAAPNHLIDVGANIGTITIPALKRGLVKVATAIEPHPDNLRLLRANIALNGLEDRVTVLPQAVGDKNGMTLQLHESLTNSGNHAIGQSGISVVSSRLDDFCFPSDSLLWMDIEGYEGHALLGAEFLLASGVPVVCEFNPEYLKRSAGCDYFRRSLSGRRLFDIGDPNGVEVTLDELAHKYSGGGKFTDVVALNRR
ncbi:FkbM family methyltransferase [Stenotrophomonas sp. UBA7606]|uniref:FkbM family methyltransferase n=1 Tax=Stenotrophomonas sp. UBA7606 TaxID=1947559 RepID=UPI0025FDC459|nr:FkbM family methyltransferase [Stenotrophomonas sp. UBA7606]